MLLLPLLLPLHCCPTGLADACACCCCSAACPHPERRSGLAVASLSPSPPHPASATTAAGAQPEITHLAWNRKVQHILGTCSAGGAVVVWDLKKQRPVISFKDPSGCDSSGS